MSDCITPLKNAVKVTKMHRPSLKEKNAVVYCLKSHKGSEHRCQKLRPSEFQLSMIF